jgi:hypothetical protein
MDLRRAYWLEYSTIGWNTAEAVNALTFGLRAGSPALTAFGIDSVIGVFAVNRGSRSLDPGAPGTPLNGPEVATVHP